MRHKRDRLALVALALACVAVSPRAIPAQEVAPKDAAAHEGDFVVRDFRFGSGETLPELRLHYLVARQAAT